eukprot:Blabericola_migrator_1__9702@NODE_530_length_7799_cov_81_595447_g404_i0_p1_GENE_NODE_530_length_7799_cov_81_595447_g404_i0NODE_530_length_7799_cov_81_595447_g404_i0_p1_ORF_typecomplete_len738_score181_47CDC73_C/PF05179_14/1_4e22Phage_B/PF02304_15/4_7Phage_B/PF02304_15/1_8e04_NODE_530_length_7799_cov_81_595447_g404_i055377750
MSDELEVLGEYCVKAKATESVIKTEDVGDPGHTDGPDGGSTIDGDMEDYMTATLPIDAQGPETWDEPDMMDGTQPMEMCTQPIVEMDESHMDVQGVPEEASEPEMDENDRSVIKMDEPSPVEGVSEAPDPHAHAETPPLMQAEASLECASEPLEPHIVAEASALIKTDEPFPTECVPEAADPHTQAQTPVLMQADEPSSIECVPHTLDSHAVADASALIKTDEPSPVECVSHTPDPHTPDPHTVEAPAVMKTDEPSPVEGVPYTPDSHTSGLHTVAETPALIKTDEPPPVECVSHTLDSHTPESHTIAPQTEAEALEMTQTDEPPSVECVTQAADLHTPVETPAMIKTDEPSPVESQSHTPDPHTPLPSDIAPMKSDTQETTCETQPSPDADEESAEMDVSSSGDERSPQKRSLRPDTGPSFQERESKRRQLIQERRNRLRHMDPWLQELRVSDIVPRVKRQNSMLPDNDSDEWQCLSFLPKLQPEWQNGVDCSHLINEVEEILRSNALLEESLKEETASNASAAVGGGSNRVKTQGGRQGSRVCTILDVIVSRYKRRPIILVPSEEMSSVSIGWQQSVLHFGNAWDFLEKGHLVLPGQKNVPEVTGLEDRPLVQQGRQILSQKFSFKTHPVKLALMDCSKACRFDKADWDSVVCVLLSGQEWELKDWPIPMDRVFEKVKVVFFTFKDAPLPKIVANNKCQVFAFPRMLRHMDGEIQRAFWASLGEHISQPADPIQT